ISNAVNTKDVNLDKEISDVKNEIIELETSLNSNRDILREIYKRSTEEDSRRKAIEEIYKFIGRLEQALENVVSTKIDSALDKKIKTLEQTLKEKNKTLKALKAESSLENILRKISVLISHYVSLLDVERKTDYVTLDLESLTLKIAA